MTWETHHSASEDYAIKAELATKNHDSLAARNLYHRAAEEEVIALSQINQGKVKTLSITVLSAASLWYKAKEFREAERFVCEWLANDLLPQNFIAQLQTVLQTIWNEKTLRESNINFAKGEILVRVAGGEVVHGGAPLDLTSLKVDEVSNLFYRTIELLLDYPLRLHGGPSADVQSRFRPWLIQAPAGSYQFAVRVQQPDQLPLFPGSNLDVENVSQKVLEIINAAASEKSSLLEESVSKPEYRPVFLKLARNLTPTGKTFKTLEMRPSSDIEAQPILLTPEAREVINQTIKSNKKIDITKKQLKEEQVVGGASCA